MSTRPAAGRACPVCQAFGKRRLFPQRFVASSEISLLDGYDVVACTGCGATFADGIPPQARIDAYYRELSKYEAGAASHAAPTPEQRHNYGELADLVERARPDREARILDLGCGNGLLLRELQARGYRALHGVDLSPSSVAALRAAGITASVGGLFDVPAGLGRFDLVVLAGVLEHVAEVATAVARLEQLLLPGGTLLVEVPDVERFQAFIAAPFQQFSVEHINFFSAVSLRTLMQRHGFEQRDLSRGIRRDGLAHEPCISAVFCAAAVPASVADAPAYDDVSEPAVREYVAASGVSFARLERVLQEVAGRHAEAYVWGTGTLCQALLARGAFERVRVRAMVDSNTRYHGRMLAGVPIIAPTAIDRSDIPIIITTILHKAAIGAQIAELGYRNEIVVLPDAHALTS